MRVLLVTRGAPGSGKSTWIKENGLQMYSLSADELRLKTSSPSILVNGSFGINQKENNKVWDLLFQILETRMKNGSLLHCYSMKMYRKRKGVKIKKILEGDDID